MSIIAKTSEVGSIVCVVGVWWVECVSVYRSDTFECEEIGGEIERGPGTEEL